MTSSVTSSKWFHRYGPFTSAPRARLACFPHAGGGPGLFRTWQARLPAGVELLAACYPGRLGRFTEPVPGTMAELAGQAAAALSEFGDAPLALFGHSMGSSVAYEVALRLPVPPLRVFVSGRGAPHHAGPSALHLADTGIFLDSVRQLGYSGSAAMDDPDLLELTLPALRADFRIIETYRPSAPPPLASPIVACYGDTDPGCEPGRAQAWAELTSSRFAIREFRGGHFYLEPLEAELLRYVSGYLVADLRLRQPAPR